MSKAAKPFNPGSFDGALTELFYATSWSGAALKNERKQLVVLRTKHKDDDKAQALADKLPVTSPSVPVDAPVVPVAEVRHE